MVLTLTQNELSKVGEIMAKSDIVMKGYLNLPEETSAILSKEGFVHTGDLARYDENGVLYYEGRLKELVSISLIIYLWRQYQKASPLFHLKIIMT